MNRTDLPTFPAFAWDGHFWVSSAKLPAWSGYQVRRGAYGSISASGRSDGTVQLLFAPEGRDSAPLLDHEIELVKWVVDHQAAVHDAMLEKLFERYPAIRLETLGLFSKDEARKVLPKIRFPEQLKELVGISSINVHQIEKDDIPFIGVELGCTWEVEHGVGILLHGSTSLEIGGADTAITLWIAKKFVKRS
jgi:hypothetical protein